MLLTIFPKSRFTILLVVLLSLNVLSLLLGYNSLNNDLKKNQEYAHLIMSSYSDMFTDICSIDSLSLKNTLIYCFSETMCDGCIYQDLKELYDWKQQIHNGKLVVLPVYANTPQNIETLQRLLHNFLYIRMDSSSVRFSVHCQTKLEQRFMAYIDANQNMKMYFFPEKGRQDMTRKYLQSIQNFFSIINR